MSVIVSRALPDVRDGLKPVHRRILYAMDGEFDYNKPFKKSARIVGEVMGKYHPHGDSSIYDAMVRMAQDFSMRVPLIASQGNFGSIDGDSPAAMRYTEARLGTAARMLLDDIHKDTVNFTPNYDESLEEPTVLPARFPNILVNGAGGIAVGMATNIPPHNLGEILDASIACIDNPEISSEELCELVPGPDFPTGAVIVGRSGSRATEMTGRGTIIVRAKTTIEEIRKDRWAIVVTEIPYQVNKEVLVARIRSLVRDKIIEGIAEVRDISDRHGIRIEIEVKRDFHPEIVLNQLFKNTSLQTSFGSNIIALNGGKPQLMNLKEILAAFIEFREEVIRRRTIYDLAQARKRAHKLAGLAIVKENIEAVVNMIRTSQDKVEAKLRLMNENWIAGEVEPLIALIDDPEHEVIDGHYKLSDVQADEILNLPLGRLTNMERQKIHDELTELGGQIKDFLAILASHDRIYSIMRQELVDVKERFATPRKTVFEELEYEQDIEDLIQREDMVVTVTNTGYIKRVPLSTYKAQKRGGKGRAGMNTHEEDYVNTLFVANTHTPILFFSTYGLVYKLKVYKLPLGTPQSTGKALVNLLPLKEREKISTIMQLPEDENEAAKLGVMFATKTGGARRNKLADFIDVRANGKIAMKLDEGDVLIDVKICTDDQDILLATKNGKSIRFPVSEIRVFSGRNSTGVRGIKLAKDDEVISMSVLKHAQADSDKRNAYLKMSKSLRKDIDENDVEDVEILNATVSLSSEEFEKMKQDEEFLLTVTDSGYGKRTSAYEYRITGRGGQGVTNIDNTKRQDKVVATFPVSDNAQVMLVTDAGKLIRMPINGVRVAGRNTMGVIMFRLNDNERVVSATCIGDFEEVSDESEDFPSLEQESDLENLKKE
ncbi:MAG: DNA gyrase subunit A [Alphaproteobacteria bacterium]|nr:DNA gyrase subunit A [Alphaproteobacteria bacterium]